MTLGEMASKSTQRLTAALRRTASPLQGIWPRTAESVIGLLALVIVLMAGLTYFTPLSRWASQVVTGNRYLAALDGLLNPFRTRHLLLNSGLPIYDLEIQRDQFAIIDDTVERARKQGLMTEDLQVWVNGRFFYEGQEYDVKLRVRGDLPSHWVGPKKSWRLKFGNLVVDYNGARLEEDFYFQGMRQINLIIPQDRDYVVAPFVTELMREAGLLVPRDRFVVLRINGVVQGLYYEVEQFDKSLLAAQGRPETSIAGQNERAMHFEQYTRYGTSVTADARYDLGTVELQVLETGPESMQALRAMQVLMDHSNNPTPANFQRAQAVLDWEKYLHFRNLTTLFNTNHVRFGSDNFKLYFDASRGLLEPVPWDVHLVRMPKEPGTIDFWNSHGPDELQRATLLDPSLRLQRNQMLWAWVSDGGEGLISRFKQLHEQIRPLAWADVLSTPIHGHRMDVLKADFEFNVRRVHKVLSLSLGNFVYRLDANDRATLEASALNFSGILLNEIRLSDPAVFAGAYQLFEDLNDNGELDPLDPLVAEASASNGTLSFRLDRYILPEVRYGGDTIDGRYWEYMEPLSGRSRYFLVGQVALADRHVLEWTPPAIQVTAANAVTGQAMGSAPIDHAQALPENTIGVTAYDASHPFDLQAPELSLTEFLHAHPEFVASQARPGAVELSGAVTLSGTIIIPKSVPLVVQPGTNITMRPGASLLSYGGLIASGTPDRWIRIHADSSGEPWGVVAVLRAPETVVLEYIEVEGGGQAILNGTLFTGGLAVHEADLHMEHCRVVNMRSEDGLNLKNGHIYLADCLFSGNASDAVDIDFGTGTVRGNHFANNVNDGLDLSGSTVTVIGNRMENNGDKGLSVGENSHPIVFNNLFVGNNIGLSAKDLSHPRVTHATFVGNALAIEAIRKKPFFGGGSAEFVNSVFADNQVLLAEDYFSSGQVVIHHSLVDDPGACPTCQSAAIHFRAPASGDYALTPDTFSQVSFDLVHVDWVDPALAGDLPGTPGAAATPVLQ